jgi:RNA polymerase sigma-70 factor, ECF subfamily
MSLATMQTAPNEAQPALQPALQHSLPAATVSAPRPLAPVLTLVTSDRSHDKGLVEQALRGGVQGARAEEALYRKYRPAVSRIAASFCELDADEAEDVTQEAFVRAFRALRSLKDHDRFAAWLFTIARNRARSYLSSRGTHQKAAEDQARESQLAGDLAPAASDQLEHEAALKAVRDVIEALREGPEKETVRLFYLEGKLSAREIAQRMGVGKSAVTMRLERFRAKVKAQILELAG